MPSFVSPDCPAWFDPRRIALFLQIAEAGSFSKAAARLGVSQTSLSRHIRTLELAAGLRVFYRDGRGVQLTEAGKRLQERAQHHAGAGGRSAGDDKCRHGTGRTCNDGHSTCHFHHPERPRGDSGHVTAPTFPAAHHGRHVGAHPRLAHDWKGGPGLALRPAQPRPHQRRTATGARPAARRSA